MKIASDEDDILSFFSSDGSYCYHKKISPVWAYLHTFLTVCRNFFDLLIVKLSQNLGHLRLRGTIFLVVGVKMSKNQTSTFEKISHLLNPIGRLNQQCSACQSNICTVCMVLDLKRDILDFHTKCIVLIHLQADCLCLIEPESVTV